MKTTTLGILTILTVAIKAAMAILAGGMPDPAVTIAGITTGWGLIHAADAK